MLFYNLKLKAYSQQLRNNMTDAERLLWSRLRRRQLNGMQVYRQRIIGNYIADFYCPAAKLIVELDGSQHYTNQGKIRDKIRDDYMRKEGINVMRFSDKEIFENLDEIIELIYQNL